MPYGRVEVRTSILILIYPGTLSRTGDFPQKFLYGEFIFLSFTCLSFISPQLKRYQKFTDNVDHVLEKVIELIEHKEWTSQATF